MICIAAFAVTPSRMLSSTAFRPSSFSTTRRSLSIAKQKLGGVTGTAATGRRVAKTAFFSERFQKPQQPRCGDSRLYLSTIATEAGSKVPITLLSGFLGAGKTVTLQHLLQNTDGVKIGVIVNDVASVNIDAKLVEQGGSITGADGVVELQNGCACCSLADELLTSVDSLLDGKRQLDAIVVELSGVADPVAIQQNWKLALQNKHPCTEKADVTQVVTLVDSSTFGTDFMTWDVAGQRDGWVDPADDCAAQRKVPELLAEQIEAANVILVNKVDLAGPEQVKVASSLVKQLNDKAEMEEVQYGRVSPQQILRTKTESFEDTDSKRCDDPDCSDSSHSHSHDHTSDSSDCSDPDCADAGHSHSHSNDHDAGCKDPDCTDPNHSHSHDHESSSCDDPNCTDPSHEHSHDHAKTATDQLGIVNFVYKANRPFNLKKLMTLLNTWPVPIKENLDMSMIDEVKDGEIRLEDGRIGGKSCFTGVLRSKGFCWMAPTRWEAGRNGDDDVWRHDTAMYWSHAGKHFGISTAGKWWGTISKEQMKDYFKDNMKEYERILKEDFVTDEFGDRRQEIVFIGVALDEDQITESLDQCLLSDKGMERYRQELGNYMNRILTSPVGGSGLFDIGGVDHLDVDK